MLKTKKNKLLKVAKETASFFVPLSEIRNVGRNSTFAKSTAVLIPTYIPTNATYRLIRSIIKWHPNVLIVVIDDCTPVNKKTIKVINKINQLAEAYEQVISLRTPTNTLKAGALNYGIEFLASLKKKPLVVFTFDDDVVINKHTIPTMTTVLYSNSQIGAVCSQVRVSNKKKNLLTRLQAIEYHSFNITKISDNGFLKGPLVMQGMLTGFRMTALEDVNGFSYKHLIEDYDITARMKSKGWNVKIAHKAVAWTTVPETVEDLWKQRVRWTFGGLTVLQQFWKKVPVVYQDVIGHLLFLNLFSLIILSFVFVKTNTPNPLLVFTLLTVSLINFLVAFVFNILTFKLYPKRDRKDWLIKFTLLPELLYSNILTLILLGSYIFFVYNLFTNTALAKKLFLHKTSRWGQVAFNRAGFSTTWGTK